MSEEQMQWVPCSERLPELRDDAVLVYWPANGAIETVHIQDWFGDMTAGVDADGNQLYAKWYLSQGVTHWMPLPEPPKDQP